jgi:hypothetical protein
MNGGKNMGTIGSFSPGVNPDTDRFAYYLGQIINSSGGIIIDFIESDNLFLGKEATDKAIFFNINGLDAPNPGIRWNNDEACLEFTSTGTLWQKLKNVTAESGSGINIADGVDTAGLSVDSAEIIDSLKGLKVTSNLIGLDFGAGHAQPARGDHTHSFTLGDLSNVGTDTAASGNVLTGNGTNWNSSTPDSAGLVTLSGSQTVEGNKTFSGGTSFSSYFDVAELTTDPSAPAENMARIYTKDNGLGKTRLCVRFHTGDPVVIAEEA